MEAGLITPHQLEHALMLQKSKSKRLGKILVELGYVSETQIAEALAKQLSLPFVDCSQYQIAEEVKSLVPKEMVEKKLVLPVGSGRLRPGSCLFHQHAESPATCVPVWEIQAIPKDHV